MKVHVIVLNYNGREHLKDCLQSLMSQTFRDFGVIVSDNGSTDDSVDFIKSNFPDIRVLESPKNYGFSKGNNLAINIAMQDDSEYVALLNSDTEVDKGWLKELVDTIESDAKIGACASKMLMFDRRNIINSAGGAVNYVGHAWPIGLGEEDLGQFKKREINFACGGAFIVKTKILGDIGLFDEDYFLYGEDTDLSWRIRLAGYKLYFSPSSVVYHKYSASFSSTFENKDRFYFLERNRLTTILKNYSFKTLILISPGIIFSEIAILYYSAITGWLGKKIECYTWNIKNIKSTLRKRAIIQSKRKIQDSEIVKNYSGTMEYGGVRNALITYLYNPISSTYWNFVKIFI